MAIAGLGDGLGQRRVQSVHTLTYTYTNLHMLRSSVERP